MQIITPDKMSVYGRIKYNIENIFFLLYVLLGMGCLNDSVAEKDLSKYILDSKNGLIQEQEINGIKISMVFRPGKLMPSKNEINPQRLNKELPASQSDNLYFLMRISSGDQSSISDLIQSADMLKKLSFKINNYVHITNSNKQTFELKASSYSPADKTPFSDVMLVFGKNGIKYENAEWIRINVDEFGLGVGDISFKFQKKDIENVNNI